MVTFWEQIITLRGIFIPFEVYLPNLPHTRRRRTNGIYLVDLLPKWLNPIKKLQGRGEGPIVVSIRKICPKITYPHTGGWGGGTNTMLVSIWWICYQNDFPTQKEEKYQWWYLSGGSATRISAPAPPMSKPDLRHTLVRPLSMPSLLPSHQVQEPYIWKTRMKENLSLDYWVYYYFNSFTSFNWQLAEICFRFLRKDMQQSDICWKFWCCF